MYGIKRYISDVLRPNDIKKYFQQLSTHPNFKNMELILLNERDITETKYARNDTEYNRKTQSRIFEFQIKGTTTGLHLKFDLNEKNQHLLNPYDIRTLPPQLKQLKQANLFKLHRQLDDRANLEWKDKVMFKYNASHQLSDAIGDNENIYKAIASKAITLDTMTKHQLQNRYNLGECIKTCFGEEIKNLIDQSVIQKGEAYEAIAHYLLQEEPLYYLGMPQPTPVHIKPQEGIQAENIYVVVTRQDFSEGGFYGDTVLFQTPLFATTNREEAEKFAAQYTNPPEDTNEYTYGHSTLFVKEILFVRGELDRISPQAFGLTNFEKPNTEHNSDDIDL